MTKDILDSLKFRLNSIKEQFGTLSDVFAFEDGVVCYGVSDDHDALRFAFDQAIFESFPVAGQFYENEKPIGDMVAVLESLQANGAFRDFKKMAVEISRLKKLKTLQIAEHARFQKWCAEKKATGKSEQMCGEAYRLQKIALEMDCEFIWSEIMKRNDGDKAKTKAEFKEQKHLTYFIFNKKISTYVNESYRRAASK